MANSIQTNVNSIIAQNNLTVNDGFQSKTIQRLTSGYRINSSSDDAAGLAVANQYRSDVAELTQGVRNANDGISSLQIVDGGLSNISQIMDRMKTLATQSASTTFSGDRATLNTEYQTLLGEMDRQASNIGLGSGQVGGRYATKIDVYIGGAAGVQGNAKVTVDMSGSKVDSVGLGVGNTNILGGGSVTYAGGAVLAGFTNILAGSSQSITVNTAKGSTTATVDGGSTGLTADQVIQQINSQIKSTGVTAQIGSNGDMQFFGDKTSFSVSAGAMTGSAANALTTGGAVSTIGSDAVNNNLNTVSVGAAFAATAGTLTFNVNGNMVGVNLTASDTIDTTQQKVNQALNAYGIYAVQETSTTAGTNELFFQSTSNFSVTPSVAGVAGFAAAGTNDSVNATSTATAAGNSLSALAQLESAVNKLGAVQGKVGTGQNQLQYSVNLANSQISSFSAAESRIRDADVANEAANLTKAQVLQQSSIAALAQANQQPQALLSLIKNA